MATDQSPRLEVIARALGLSAEALSGEADGGEIRDTLLLLRLWAAIGDAQGRTRVLNLARREAERAGYRESHPTAAHRRMEPDPSA